ELAVRQLLARLREEKVGVRIGFKIKIDIQNGAGVVGRIQRVHVIHVVHAVDLLLDGRGYGFLKRLTVGARVWSRNSYFRWSDIRKLRYRKTRDGDATDDNHQDGNYDGNDGTIDEEFRHD